MSSYILPSQKTKKKKKRRSLDPYKKKIILYDHKKVTIVKIVRLFTTLYRISDKFLLINDKIVSIRSSYENNDKIMLTRGKMFIKYCFC